MMIDSGNQRVKTTNYDGEVTNVWLCLEQVQVSSQSRHERKVLIIHATSCTYRGDWGVEVNENKFI
jgi:hypothetical protein